MAEIRRFLRLKEVKTRVGLGTTCIYQKIKSGEFPHAYPIGSRARAWLSTDIDAWIDSRLAASRPAGDA